MKAAFAIPAINNHLEALAIHLNIDSSVDSLMSQIEQRVTSGVIHSYKYQDAFYVVGSISSGVDSKAAISFNSSLWCVREIDNESPYHVFTDEKVIRQLSTMAPSGYSLLAVNQKEHRLLFRIHANLFVIYAYASHYPHELSSYFLQGSTASTMRDAQSLFANSYYFKDGDQMIYDNCDAGNP